MARINLAQAINLTIVVEEGGKPSQKTLNLVRGVNEVDPSILTHPYIQSHMKAGSASIVPDPMDPEDVAAAAEEIARRARAEADAARGLREAKQKEIDDALAAASKPVAAVGQASAETTSDPAPASATNDDAAPAASDPAPVA